MAELALPRLKPFHGAGKEKWTVWVEMFKLTLRPEDSDSEKLRKLQLALAHDGPAADFFVNSVKGVATFEQAESRMASRFPSRSPAEARAEIARVKPPTPETLRAEFGYDLLQLYRDAYPGSNEQQKAVVNELATDKLISLVHPDVALILQREKDEGRLDAYEKVLELARKETELRHMMTVKPQPVLSVGTWPEKEEIPEQQSPDLQPHQMSRTELVAEVTALRAMTANNQWQKQKSDKFHAYQSENQQ